MKNQFFTKKSTYVIIGFALVALLSSSCSKEDSDDEGGGTGEGYSITFKVDNVFKEYADQDFPPVGNFTDNGAQYGGAFAATGYATSVSFQVYDT